MQIARQPSFAVQSLKKDVKKNIDIEQVSELENSVLEINHVTNVTTVLQVNETTASDRVSRFSLASLPRSLSVRTCVSEDLCV